MGYSSQGLNGFSPFSSLLFSLGSLFISMAFAPKGQELSRPGSPTRGHMSSSVKAPEGQPTLDTIPMMLGEDLERIHKEFRIPGDLKLEVPSIFGRVTVARGGKVTMYESNSDFLCP